MIIIFIKVTLGPVWSFQTNRAWLSYSICGSFRYQIWVYFVVMYLVYDHNLWDSFFGIDHLVLRTPPRLSVLLEIWAKLSLFIRLYILVENTYIFYFFIYLYFSVPPFTSYSVAKEKYYNCIFQQNCFIRLSCSRWKWRYLRVKTRRCKHIVRLKWNFRSSFGRWANAKLLPLGQAACQL